MRLHLTGTQELETDRLILRRFEAGDAEAMHRNWASDEAVARFLSWSPHESAGVTRGVIDGWTAAYADPRTYNWAIVLKETGEPIGSIGLHNFREEDFKAEAGYCIGRRWWGRGLTAEALRAVIQFSFETVGLNRVEACHDVENTASGRVMQKAGMAREGRFRQWKCRNGSPRDYDFYAVLRDDYLKTGR